MQPFPATPVRKGKFHCEMKWNNLVEENLFSRKNVCYLISDANLILLKKRSAVGYNFLPLFGTFDPLIPDIKLIVPIFMKHGIMSFWNVKSDIKYLSHDVFICWEI